MLDSLLQHLAQADLERAASDGSARGGLSDDRTFDLEFARNAGRLGDKGDVGKSLDRYAKMPENDKFTCENIHVLELRSGKPLFPFGEVINITGVPGFMQYDRNRQPQEFSIYRYAVDVTIPVVDLDAYSQYFPASGWVRALSVLQHLTGWWVLTSFLASLAVI